jgi:hypothetical protein
MNPPGKTQAVTSWVGKIRPQGFFAGKTKPPYRDSNTFDRWILFDYSAGDQRHWSNDGIWKVKRDLRAPGVSRLSLFESYLTNWNDLTI